MGGYSSKVASPSSSTVVQQQQKEQIKQKKKPEITNIDRTILDLKVTRDKLQKYKHRLLIEDERLMYKIKQAKLHNNTSYAISLLKLHHYKKQQYESCNDQLLNILQMVQTIDSTQNDIMIINAMKMGKDTLQQIQNEISIDDIVELMDTIQEQNNTEHEISMILQQNIPNITNQVIETDEELLSELESLVQQQGVGVAGETTATTTTTTTDDLVLPNVPTHTLPELPVTTTATTSTTTTTPIQNEEERIAVLG